MKPEGIEPQMWKQQVELTQQRKGAILRRSAYQQDTQKTTTRAKLARLRRRVRLAYALAMLKRWGPWVLAALAVAAALFVGLGR